MQVIFVTPLLWRKLDRAALRRGEEGQALVIVALLAVILVAMMGLSVDSGLAYITSQQLQRAADAAALAGVVFEPNNNTVADARASLSAEANGAKVACYYDSGKPATDPYNQRCHRVSMSVLTSSKSDQDLYYMETSTPPGTEIQYRVTLAKRQPRFFMSVLDIINPGFGEFTIQRTATAAFTQLVRFGSSFNYFGTNGVLYDHYMRCGSTSAGACAGNGFTELNMRGATYQKYVLMRCNQPNPPAGVCVGGFWGHIAGPDMVHGNGDAFTPFRDGAYGLSGGGCGVGASCVTTSGGQVEQCLHTSDADYSSAANGNFATWFINDVFQPNGSACDQRNGANYPVVNFDTHPDAPGGAGGFGYEIGVQVDDSAIFNINATQQNLANHTNLNITIFDAAMNDQGAGETGVADNFQPQNGSGIYNQYPHQNWSEHHDAAITTANQWETRTFICSPGTSGCTAATPSSPTKPTPKRSPGSSDLANPSYTGGLAALFPDPNNVELTYNDMRTRFTLYGPPAIPSIPATYQNVVGNRIDSFEATDMSIRVADGGRTHDFPIKDSYGSPSYCYFIFDDQKVFWNNTRDISANNTKPISPSVSLGTTGNGTGPDYAYQYSSAGKITGQQPSTQRYSYVCPDNNSTSGADYRWNVMLGTPTARYGPQLGAANQMRTIEAPILRVDGGVSDIITSPIATGTLESNLVLVKIGNQVYTDTITPVDVDPKQAFTSGFVKSIWDPTYVLSKTVSGKAQIALGYTNIVDPGQNCRPSAVDLTDLNAPGWTIDAQWGHNRIPFNMAYNDPLTNRVWVTDTTRIASPITNTVTTQKLAGYYTIAYPFHGWRCDWDFDSNYKNNPLQDPTQPPGTGNLSLSGAEQALNGAFYNKAFAEGHPGLTSNGYMDRLLADDNVDPSGPNYQRCRDMIPTGGGTGNKWAVNCGITNSQLAGDTSAWADRDFGLEPYFHLSNVGWDATRQNLAIVSNTIVPPVRAGTYMVHIQTFGGTGANRYSLKAEYENPRIYTDPGSGVVVTPVPNVFAVTAMALYANNQNSGSITDQNIVFDLANIPPANSGTLAIVELWDPGDISGNLFIEVRKPSGWGPRINTNGSSTISSWKVPWYDTDPTTADNAPIPTKLTVCPYTLNAGSAQLAKTCSSSPTGGTSTAWQAAQGGGYYNDEWMLMSFTIPSGAEYNKWRTDCASHGVPEGLCYYYQINYHLQGSGASANDTTTWQLIVQGQPVHLVP